MLEEIGQVGCGSAFWVCISSSVLPPSLRPSSELDSSSHGIAAPSRLLTVPIVLVSPLFEFYSQSSIKKTREPRGSWVFLQRNSQISDLMLTSDYTIRYCSDHTL